MNEKTATKSAIELGIPETHRAALAEVLSLLESGKFVHAHPLHWEDHDRPFDNQFNMAHWKDNFDCGTVCCIGGAAETIGNVNFRDCMNQGLFDLFNPDTDARMEDIKPTQAAIALRSYLTSGEPQWTKALHSVTELT